MKEAIQKAIEGGYKDQVLIEWCNGAQNDAPLLLDPSFWQCLGKSLGWGEIVCPKCGTNSLKGQEEHMYEWCCEYCGLCEKEWPIDFQKGYMYQWHQFIDHLAEGKDPELFFKNLLT